MAGESPGQTRRIVRVAPDHDRPDVRIGVRLIDSFSRCERHAGAGEFRHRRNGDQAQPIAPPRAFGSSCCPPSSRVRQSVRTQPTYEIQLRPSQGVSRSAAGCGQVLVRCRPRRACRARQPALECVRKLTRSRSPPKTSTTKPPCRCRSATSCSTRTLVNCVEGPNLFDCRRRRFSFSRFSSPNDRKPCPRRTFRTGSGPIRSSSRRIWRISSVRFGKRSEKTRWIRASSVPSPDTATRSATWLQKSTSRGLGPGRLPRGGAGQRLRLERRDSSPPSAMQRGLCSSRRRPRTTGGSCWPCCRSRT